MKMYACCIPQVSLSMLPYSMQQTDDKGELL